MHRMMARACKGGACKIVKEIDIFICMQIRQYEYSNAVELIYIYIFITIP